ncbi:MAG: RNHCP domain-containing protein [Oscillospiraceae bacterium]|nr:RNHCP domain-containing protein [Oscillospiraceae bacterium]
MNTFYQKQRNSENTGFVCAFCGAEVKPLNNGSYRNHCPHCLYSLHVDNIPGDRGNDCRGLMKPVGIRYNGKKGWQIIHNCQKCGAEKVNRTAPDEVESIIQMMKQGKIY